MGKTEKEIKNIFIKDAPKSTLDKWVSVLIIAGNLATILLVIFAAMNYDRFVDNLAYVRSNLELVRKSLEISQNSYKKFIENLDLVAKDVELSHSPTVYILPSKPDENTSPLDPLNIPFVLINSGKLSASDVIVCAAYWCEGEGLKIRDGIIQNSIIYGIKLYPNVNLTFHVQPIKHNKTISKSEITFYIYYRSEAASRIQKEKMRFIFTRENRNWSYVTNDFTIFKRERDELAKDEAKKGLSELNATREWIRKLDLPEDFKNEMVKEIESRFKAGGG